MKKRILSYTLVLLLSMLVMCSMAMAASSDVPEEADWYWISSDTKYSKYYGTDKVTVEQAFGSVPVKINAWTKTAYTLEGAEETFENYGISDISPQRLSYSLAEVTVNPQNRTFAYLQEFFYDANGNLLWEKVYDPVHPKEINSQQFDEDFYVNIVDSVLGQGENDRRVAEDRWLSLWQSDGADGSSRSMADTTTMRMKGENIIYWEWQEYKNAAGAVTEVRFQKKAVNLNHATAKINRYQRWDAARNWQDYTKNIDGMYYAIEPGSAEEKGLIVLQQYAAEHEDWVYRYSLDRTE